MFSNNNNTFKILIFACLVNFIYGKVSRTEEASNYVLVPCIENDECDYVNGTCIKGFCNCNNSHNCRVVQHTLVNKLGGSCQTTADCNMPFAVCDENKECSCRDGYVSSHEKRKCLKAARGLGGSCEESIQCYVKTPSTGCHENKCVCQQHMHEYNGSCYKNVDLHEPCQLFGECSLIPHASCIKSECQCNDNYVSTGSKCLLKANGINFTCSEDVQCTSQLGSGSECSSTMGCRCKELFQYKSSKHLCVHDLLLNEECATHSDCHQPGTGPSRLECVLGVCKCKSPFLEESGFCISSSTTAVLFKSMMLFLGTLFLIK